MTVDLSTYNYLILSTYNVEVIKKNYCHLKFIEHLSNGTFKNEIFKLQFVSASMIDIFTNSEF